MVACVRKVLITALLLSAFGPAPAFAAIEMREAVSAPPAPPPEANEQQKAEWDQIMSAIKHWDGTDGAALAIKNQLQVHFNRWYAGSMDPARQNYGAWYQDFWLGVLCDLPKLRNYLRAKQEALNSAGVEPGTCEWNNAGVMFTQGTSDVDEYTLGSAISRGLARRRAIGTYTSPGDSGSDGAQLEREMHGLASPTRKPRFRIHITHQDLADDCIRSFIQIIDRKLGVVVSSWYLDYCPPIQGGVDNEDRIAQRERAGEAYARLIEREIRKHLNALKERPTNPGVRPGGTK